MFTGLPALNHEQQQQAVERIQELMKQGVSSGQAITQVVQEIRQNYQGEVVWARFASEEDEE